MDLMMKHLGKDREIKDNKSYQGMMVKIHKYKNKECKVEEGKQKITMYIVKNGMVLGLFTKITKYGEVNTYLVRDIEYLAEFFEYIHEVRGFKDRVNEVKWHEKCQNCGIL